MYAAICYHILTEGDQHPSYLFEKLAMLNEGENAFTYLDYHNMKKAIDYCTRWHIKIPESWIKEYALQLEGVKALENILITTQIHF